MLAGTPILTGNTIEKTAFVVQFLAVRRFRWILHEMYSAVNSKSIYMTFKIQDKGLWRFIQVRTSDHASKTFHTRIKFPAFSVNGLSDICELIHFLNKQRRKSFDLPVL